MSVVIIDADPIIYSAGFASQSTIYDVVYEDDKGVLHQEVWGNGNEKLKFFRQNPAFTIVSEERRIEVKDVGFARQAAKTQLSSIVRTCAQDLGVDEPQVEIYLSGPGNFRYKLATIAPYKADRPPPPVHYQALRDYLCQRWSAVVISGMEADDKVSIRCRELTADGTPVVLATIDKDLDQVPCRHYDYKNHVFYDVGAEYAQMFLFAQTLSGDSTDNIPGCYRLGAAKAMKMVEEWYNFAQENHLNQHAHVWDNIVETYATVMEKYPDRYPEGMKPADAALETARLVFMQEYEGQLWNPPGVAHGEISSLAAA
jgi:hypothetical protein